MGAFRLLHSQLRRISLRGDFDAPRGVSGTAGCGRGAYGEDAVPSQGRWAVSALNLPADVLEPVYRTNARRVLGLS